MSLMFSGIGVSRGVAIGEAHLVRRNQVDVSAKKLTKRAVPGEVKRLRQAIKTARKELLTARDAIPADTGGDIAAFIESHILMLDDSLLSKRPIETIKNEQCNAEAALQQQREELSRVFTSMDDKYIATRIDDVNHVIDAVLRALDDNNETFGGDHWKGQIVIADDLTPADTVVMRNHGVAGFITETGGQLSHTAILARSLGIPAIVGVHNVREYIKSGETITLNGESGLILAEATDDMLAGFRKQQKALKQQQRELAKINDMQAVTRDGVKLQLNVNIEIDDDLKAMKRVNADGVGLYRTEFLYLNENQVPSEQEHFKAYTKVLRALKGAPLTLRTADLGADKDFSVVPGNTRRTQQHNPAMGMRGIRLCLNDTSIFVPQLRAILRASMRGPIRILLPMLTNLSEVEQSLKLIESIKEDLRSEGIEFDEDIPVGGMIEVPAAAIAAEQFAECLDFLSIGTNDLIQYTLAIDRIDDQMHYLYDPLHPAVLQLISHVIAAGRQANIPIAMCGEMAGDPRYVRLLLGLGLTDFSMPPNSLLEVKRCLIDSRRVRLRKLAQEMLKASTAKEKQNLLARINGN